MKIKRTWNGMSVREACVRNDWCTKMTNEYYAELLDSVENIDPTYENIWNLAEDIVDGSSLEKYGQTRLENVASVMFVIEQDVVHTFFELEETDYAPEEFQVEE